VAKKKTSRKTAPSASKKKAATKKSARKAPIKKKVAKKPAAKKPVTKKSTTKKPTAKKAPPKKVAKKPATKKSVTKKITKKPAAKKPTTKKAPLKKSTTKKSTTKKPTTKKKPAASSSKKTPAVPVKKPAAIKPLFGAWDASATKKSQAAAAKLAAAAGLAPVQAATATKDTGDKNTKRLTKSPLTKKQLRDFRELLIRKRRVILGDVNAIESEALTGSDSGASSRLPQHMADAGSDTYDQSLALDLVASQREMLKKIDAAIEKIDNNTYGICEALGVPINLERLEATPWAHLSIDAARQEERAAHP
jgi:DnaK suppressor protein